MYKKEIIPNFIKLVNNQLQYKAVYENDSLIEYEYQKANFDIFSFNKTNQSDYIEGNIDDKMFVKICDLEVINESKDSRISVFEGIFTQIKCKKETKIWLKILGTNHGNN